MNAKRFLRGAFLAAAAGLTVVVISAISTAQVSAKPSEPELERSAEQELSGTLAAVDDRSLTVDGVKVYLDGATQIKASLKAGDWIKVRSVRWGDGSYLSRGVEKVGLAGSGFEDSGHHAEAADEHSSQPSSHDHHDSHSSSEDHHGGHH